MAEFGPGSSKIVRSDENVLITEVTRFDGSVDTYSQTVYYDGEGGSSHNPPVLISSTPATPAEPEPAPAPRTISTPSGFPGAPATTGGGGGGSGATAAALPVFNEIVDLIETGLTMAERQNQFQMELTATALAAQLRIAERQLALQEEALSLEQARFGREEAQFNLQQLMAPELLTAMGINVTTDKEGKITAFDIDTSAFTNPEINRLSEMYAQKVGDAAAGKVPPLLEQIFTERESRLRATMRANLGPGFETSTPFLQAMSLFDREKNLAISEANRQDLLAFGGALSQAEAFQEQLIQSKLQSAMFALDPQTRQNVSVPNALMPTIPNIDPGASFFSTAASTQSNLFNTLTSADLAREEMLNNLFISGQTLGFNMLQLEQARELQLAELQNRIDVANIQASAQRSGDTKDIIGDALGIGLGIGLSPGGFLGSSQRFKKDIEPVDGHTVLARLREVPIHTWKYKHEDIPHMGPMAEEFHAAFKMGDTDMAIYYIDAIGVAYAAIQALTQKVEDLQRALNERAS